MCLYMILISCGSHVKCHGGLFLSQISGEAVGEVKAVADMHERKAEMARQADAFFALPGVCF